MKREILPPASAFTEKDTVRKGALPCGHEVWCRVSSGGCARCAVGGGKV